MKVEYEKRLSALLLIAALSWLFCGTLTGVIISCVSYVIGLIVADQSQLPKE